MRGFLHAFSLGWLLILAGCGGRPQIGTGPDVVFVVPGVAGDGAAYDGLVRALRQQHSGAIRVVPWGAAKPLFFVNLSSQSIHERAESRLADEIDDWHFRHPHGRIVLIGHSAGCGVILGALPRMQQRESVDEVILLAPSVSPQYDLTPALARVSGTMHVFVSDRDTVFLEWRTRNFGTYDRVRTPAAGNRGFELDALPPALRSRIMQHSYDPQWSSLRHGGGHFGPLARPFASEILMPLVHTSRSSAANPH